MGTALKKEHRFLAGHEVRGGAHEGRFRGNETQPFENQESHPPFKPFLGNLNSFSLRENDENV
jgi:hypothetical protein